MAHSLQVCAVCMSILSAVLMIVAMATNSWIEGCTNMQTISAYVNSLLSKSNSSLVKENLIHENGICVHRGLFTNKYTFGSASEIQLSTAGDHYVRSTAGLIIASLILDIAAIIMIFNKAFSSVEVLKFWHLTSKIGTVLLGIAAVVLTAGMIIYSSVEKVDEYQLNSHDENFLAFEQHLRSAYNASLSSGESSTVVYFPSIATAHYQFSFALGWASLVLLVLCVLFMLNSFRKKPSSIQHPPPGHEYYVAA